MTALPQPQSMQQWPAAPEFLVVGGRYDGNKVFLMASRQLLDIKVQEDLQTEDMRGFRGEPLRSILTGRRVDVSARMRDYVMVTGDSYAECFATLFCGWDPPTQQQLVMVLTAMLLGESSWPRE